MAKFANDDVIDAALNEVAEGTIMTVCSQQPTTRTEAVTTYALADVTMTPGAGNGDFTIANGDVSGRKLTMTQKDNITIDDDGDATHIAICDGSRLLLVTTCVSQPLVAGNTVTFPSWKIEITDPS